MLLSKYNSDKLRVVILSVDCYSYIMSVDLRFSK